MVLSASLERLERVMADKGVPLCEVLLPGMSDDEILGLHHEFLPEIDWRIPEDAMEWWRFWGGADSEALPKGSYADLAPGMAFSDLRFLLWQWQGCVRQAVGDGMAPEHWLAGDYGLVMSDSGGWFMAVVEDEAGEHQWLRETHWENEMTWAPWAVQLAFRGQDVSLPMWVDRLADAWEADRIALPYATYVNRTRVLASTRCTPGRSRPARHHRSSIPTHR